MICAVTPAPEASASAATATEEIIGVPNWFMLRGRART
jgi:hypothetical protein